MAEAHAGYELWDLFLGALRRHRWWWPAVLGAVIAVLLWTLAGLAWQWSALLGAGVMTTGIWVALDPKQSAQA